ncbi:MAG: hypothetical protein NT099_04990 [Candidatus Saganbacteria bacterium]|nr:hypothetical protein [Candidatus Saganbacteria bacterium]
MKKKKAWKDFEIAKVKLNPEQAVLSCCESSGKHLSDPGRGFQCFDGGDCTGGISGTSS